MFAYQLLNTHTKKKPNRLLVFNRSLNVKKLSKLFDNHRLSLEILERLGFNWEHNRLILQFKLLELSTIIKSIMFCQLRYKMSSHLIQTVIYLVKHNGISNHDQPTDNPKNNDCVDAVISEMIDTLPKSVLQDNAQLIHRCIEKNDSQKLKQLLNKLNVPLYHKEFDTRFAHCDVSQDILGFAERLEKGLKDTTLLTLANIDSNYNIFDVLLKINMKCWDFLSLNCSTPVINNLMEIFIEQNFDFSKEDDILIFSKIVADRRMAELMYREIEKNEIVINNAVVKCLANAHSNKEKRMLIDSLKILNIRHAFNARNQAWRKRDYGYYKSYDEITEDYRQSFEQDATDYRDKLIKFESESKKVCKLLLGKNKQWKCYACDLMNNDDINRCLRCNKGINPLFPARQNKSQIFCVSKPFGLIHILVCCIVCVF